VDVDVVGKVFTKLVDVLLLAPQRFFDFAGLMGWPFVFYCLQCRILFGVFFFTNFSGWCLNLTFFHELYTFSSFVYTMPPSHSFSS